MLKKKKRWPVISDGRGQRGDRKACPEKSQISNEDFHIMPANEKMFHLITPKWNECHLSKIVFFSRAVSFFGETVTFMLC